MGQQLARHRRRLGSVEDERRLAFKPFGGWNYSYSEDYQRNCSFIIWAAVTAGSLAVDWREAALVLGGSLWAQETVKNSPGSNGASWVHNVQAGYLLYHVYFRNNRRLLPLLGVLAEAAGDVGAVVQEYVLKHDVHYGHYAHAEGLAVGLVAGWLLDRGFKKKVSLL